MSSSARKVDVHVKCPCSQSCNHRTSEVHVIDNNHVRFIFNEDDAKSHEPPRRRSRHSSSGSYSRTSSSSSPSPSSTDNAGRSVGKPPTKRHRSNRSDTSGSDHKGTTTPSSYTSSMASSAGPSLNTGLVPTSNIASGTSSLPTFPDPFWANLPPLPEKFMESSGMGDSDTDTVPRAPETNTNSNMGHDFFDFSQYENILGGEHALSGDLPLCGSNLTMPTSVPVEGKQGGGAVDPLQAMFNAPHEDNQTTKAQASSGDGTALPSSDTGDPHLMHKRTNRLDRLLSTLQRASMPSAAVHNNTVAKLLELQKKGVWDTNKTSERCCGATDEEAYPSPLVKFIADILAWESFRQDEENLIEQRSYTAISASKEVNARMMSTRGRNMKTRDWASDGRKAARMTFDTLADQPPAAQLFTLMLLAAHVSSDHMLKTAHFPALRERFAGSLGHIVQQRAGDWSQLADQGYFIIAPSQLL